MTISIHPWSEEGLFNKAKLYVDQMESQSDNNSQSGLLSAQGLELLARAALSHISPSLLADSRDWRNLTYALGVDTKGSDYRARSISSTELYERIHKLVPDFTEEDRRFCLRHADRRNKELHTGELAFEEDLDWRPRFYHVCKILVKFMDREMIDFVSDHKTAQKMLESLRDTSAKSVNQVIRAHETVWSSKTETEREKAAHDAEIRASPNKGHRVECPSCGSRGLIRGEPIGKTDARLNDDNEVTVRQLMLPSSFECTACGLKITGLSRLNACRLGSTFASTMRYPVDEYYEDLIRTYAEDYIHDEYQGYMNE